MLRELLLGRLDAIERIGKLERRVDSIEHNVKRIGDGVSYLVRQMSKPQVPVRRRIGFGASETDKPTKPYGKLQQ